MPYGDDDDWLLSLPLFRVSGQGILAALAAGWRALTVREKQPLEQASGAGVRMPRWCQLSSGVCSIPTSGSR